MAHCPSCGAPHDGSCPAVLDASGRHNIVLAGRYELVGFLGQGGMGTVYMGRDLRLHNRPCVIKKLRDDFYRDEDREKAVGYFKREADVLSRLEHPHIVHILDYFEERLDYFLVMEYVDGEDLLNILKKRGQPFSEPEVLTWALEILDVLDYLHHHFPPVIYRDLKPSNIMIDLKGRVKLVDFGIARPFEAPGDHTHVISAGYSPPEQYWGQADPRSDLYALGATMQFLLTGMEPVALHVSSPKQLRPDLSKSTESIVERATSQDASMRFQSACEMKDAILRSTDSPLIDGRTHAMEVLVGLVILLLTAFLFLAFQNFGDSVANKTREATGEVGTEHNKDSRDRQWSKVDHPIEPSEEKSSWRVRNYQSLTPETPGPALKANLAFPVTDEADCTDLDGLKSLQSD